MTYQIDLYNDLPVLHAAWDDDFVFAEHIGPFAAEVRKILDEQAVPVYYVLDLTDWDKKPAAEVMVDEAFSGGSGEAKLTHPMNRATLVVTTGDTTDEPADGADEATYRLFDTLEDALSYVAENK